MAAQEVFTRQQPASERDLADRWGSMVDVNAPASKNRRATRDDLLTAMYPVEGWSKPSLVRLLGWYLKNVHDTDQVRHVLAEAASALTSRVQRPERRISPGAKQLTKAQNEAIVAAYQAGRPVVNIAIDFGVTSWTVWYRIKQAGGARRSHRITEAEVNRAVELRAQGLSVNKIADQLGCARLSVTRELKRRCAF